MYTSHLYWDSQACLAHCATHTPLLLRFFAFEKLDGAAPDETRPGRRSTQVRRNATRVLGGGRAVHALAGRPSRRSGGPGRPAPGRRGFSTGLRDSGSDAPTGPKVPSPGKCVHRISSHAQRKVRPSRSFVLIYKPILSIILSMWCGWEGVAEWGSVNTRANIAIGYVLCVAYCVVVCWSAQRMHRSRTVAARCCLVC